MNAMVAEDCFPIRPGAASALGLDYLALRHWHSFAPYEGDVTSARMADSGTHETTKFGERDSGNVLIVEVSGRGEMPRLTRVPTGALHWQQLIREIGGAVDVEHVIREIDALPDPAQSLLEVRLTGILHPLQLKHMGELRDTIAARFPLLGRVDDPSCRRPRKTMLGQTPFRRGFCERSPVPFDRMAPRAPPRH
jgi:hypothetical protein